MYCRSNHNIISCYVEVEDGFVVYRGLIPFGNFGFSGYYYKISDSSLAIQLYIGRVPFYAKDGIVDIRVEDEKIHDINRVVLWGEDEENNVVVWDKENGFTYSEYLKELWNKEADYKYK